jgi:hypothetical protein
MHALTRTLLNALLEDADELVLFAVPARSARISLSDARILGWRLLSPDELRLIASELFDLASASDGVMSVQMRTSGVGTVSLELASRAWLRDALRGGLARIAA